MNNFDGEIKDTDIEDVGYSVYFNHGDYFIAVMPMTFGKGRIILSDWFTIDNAWCYEKYITAFFALCDWNKIIDKEKEPSGWMRNPIDGRRRPNGDKTKEYIAR